jgi:ribonuclease HI
VARNTALSPKPISNPSTGAATSAAIGPIADIVINDRRLSMAAAHASQVRAPVAVPLNTRVRSSHEKPGTNAAATLADINTTRESRKTQGRGCRRRGMTTVVTAKAPTWIIENQPAVPRPTPKRSATSGIRKGVAPNRNVTAAADARRAGGAPRLNAVRDRIGANTGAIFACQDRTVTRIRVYTDGACSGNPGPGGWAWIVPDGPFAAGADDPTTNQRMELTAVLEAVRALDGPLEVISDSAYVVNCFRDRWWEGWVRRGWTNSQRKPVANRDLWEPLVELYQERDLVFRWVKAHAGDRWNELADRLAVEAAAPRRHGAGSGRRTRSGRRTHRRSGERSLRTICPTGGSSSSSATGHPNSVAMARPTPAGRYDVGWWTSSPPNVPSILISMS